MRSRPHRRPGRASRRRRYGARILARDTEFGGCPAVPRSRSLERPSDRLPWHLSIPGVERGFQSKTCSVSVIQVISSGTLSPGSAGHRIDRLGPAILADEAIRDPGPAPQPSASLRASDAMKAITSRVRSVLRGFDALPSSARFRTPCRIASMRKNENTT